MTVPIEEAHEAFTHLLEPAFEGTEPGLAEENLQARIRGTLLMAISNKFDWMVLTTGNKSEMATGYSTLYGDMAGGFAVIKDVPKMLVYALCVDRNERAGRDADPASPCSRSRRAPSCGRTRRTRTRSRPYAVLDEVLEDYVEEDLSAARDRGRGLRPRRSSHRVVDARRPQRVQAAPGPARASGCRRRRSARTGRLPITNRWSG